MSLTNTQIKFFADFIQANLGIVYLEANYYQLEKRLEDIAKTLLLPNVNELYLKALKGIDGVFKQVLLDVATNNETSFFRDPKVYAAFEKKILPELRIQNPKNTLFRIWSAAASFGQEPYSIAMAVEEFLRLNPGHPRFEIIATDVADHALKRCKEATYSQLEVQRGLPSSKLIQYFKKDANDYWTLNVDIKMMLRFQKQNLLDSFGPLGQFDVIFCRYVLIYQDQEKKKEILSRLAKALTPNGVLIMGASESMFGLSDDFKQINGDGAIWYQRKS